MDIGSILFQAMIAGMAAAGFGASLSLGKRVKELEKKVKKLDKDLISIVISQTKKGPNIE